MCLGFRVCVCACVYMVVCGHSHFPLVNCMFYTKSKDFYRPSKSLLHFLHLSSPPLPPLLLSPHHPPTILPCVMHHLCRAGRPIITPACEYWSTAPVCMCYFKMLRPVISVLMIVIAEATSSVRLFPAWRYQREDGSLNTHIQANTYAEGRQFKSGWRRAGVLMRVNAALGLSGSNLQRGSLPAVCPSQKWKFISHTHLYHLPRAAAFNCVCSSVYVYKIGIHGSCHIWERWRHSCMKIFNTFRRVWDCILPVYPFFFFFCTDIDINKWCVCMCVVCECVCTLPAIS